MVKDHYQCFAHDADLPSIRRCIREGHRTLILMRGIPGSGKSTLAKELAAHSEESLIYSVDDLFTVNGQYQFNPQYLDNHHNTVKTKVKQALEDSAPLVIVDNTNLHIMHIKPPIQQALRHSYEIYIVEPNTAWKYKPGMCAGKNQHGVPKYAIERSLEILQTERVDINKILQDFGYQLCIQPPMLDAEEIEDLNESFASGSASSGARSSRSTDVTSDRGSRAGSSSVPGSGSPPSSRYATPTPPDDVVELEEVDDEEVVDRIVTTVSQISLSSESVHAAAASQQKAKGPLFTMKPMQIAVSAAPPPGLSFISLSPVTERPKISIPSRECSTQCSEMLICMTSFQHPVDFNEWTLGCEKNVERIKDERPHMTDRVSQTSIANIPPTQMDLLVAMFPEEPQQHLLHFVENFGFETAVRVLIEIGARVQLVGLVERGLFSIDVVRDEVSSSVPEAPVPATRVVDHAFERLHVFGTNSLTDAPSSSSTSRSSEDNQIPVDPKNQTYNVDIGATLATQLAIMFGEDDEADLPPGDYMIPKWALETLFKACKRTLGDMDFVPFVEAHGGSLSSAESQVDSSPSEDGQSTTGVEESVAETDEELAARLQAEMDREDELAQLERADMQEKFHLNGADIIKIRHLMEKYRNVAPKEVVEIFFQCEKNSTNADSHLKLVYGDPDNYEIKVRHASGASSTGSGPQTQKLRPKTTHTKRGETSRTSRARSGYTKDNYEGLDDFGQAHALVRPLREKANQLNERSQNQYFSAKKCMNGTPHAKLTNSHYVREGQRFKQEANDLIQQADDILAECNRNNNFLDLHLMSLSGAMQVVRERLKKIKCERRGASGGRELRIITGYGKEDGIGRLKESVVAHLTQHRYNFHSSNQGELVVKFA